MFFRRVVFFGYIVYEREGGVEKSSMRVVRSAGIVLVQ